MFEVFSLHFDVLLKQSRWEGTFGPPCIFINTDLCRRFQVIYRRKNRRLSLVLYFASVWSCLKTMQLDFCTVIFIIISNIVFNF